MRLAGGLSRHAAPVLALLLATSGSARAGEGALDLYGGATLNRPADLSISETTSSGTTSAAASIDLPASGEIGLRLQGWLPSQNWIGLGLDVGYFQAKGPGIDIDAFPFSMFLILRAPLFASPYRPGGSLQPYVMAGISFYMIDISVELEGMSASAFEPGWPLPGSNDNLVTGPYAAAGLSWQPTRSFAFFGEYRYSTFDVGFDTTNSPIFPTMNGRVDASVTSDHVLFGISYRFGEVGATAPGP